MRNFGMEVRDGRHVVVVSAEALAWLSAVAKVAVAAPPSEGDPASSASGNTTTTTTTTTAAAASMDDLTRRLERMYLTAHKRAATRFRVCLPHQAATCAGVGAYAFASPALPGGVPVVQESVGGWDRAGIVGAFRAAQKGRSAAALIVELAPFVEALLDGPGTRTAAFTFGKTTSSKPTPRTSGRAARARLLRDGMCSRFNHKYKEYRHTHGFTHLIAVAAFERHGPGHVADYDYRDPEDAALDLESELFRRFRAHPRFAADVSASSSGGLAKGKPWAYTAITYIAIAVSPAAGAARGGRGGECGCAVEGAEEGAEEGVAANRRALPSPPLPSLPPCSSSSVDNGAALSYVSSDEEEEDDEDDAYEDATVGTARWH